MKSVPRLFDGFMPKHYDLTLTIDRDGRQCSGDLVLAGLSEQPGDITLHAKDLIIIHATVDGVVVNTILGNNDTVILNANADRGEHEIILSFRSKITDTMHGLYPSYYTLAGAKKEILSTQFESHHARVVFLCIDEPEAKAIFELTIETEKDLQVLSNTPVATRRYAEETTITRFEKTPRMSTYLLAFVIGELHRVHTTTTSGIEVSVYASHAHDNESLSFALDIAKRGIEFFEDYFGTPYPLAKCDHIAIPDFSAGAMENWGLITYRERALIASETSSQSAKELIATVICHELSHQWFGNLVTMKWWDDLWLNESFANMMEYVAVDALEPSWEIWQTFASKEMTSALSRDYLAGVQPVKVTVHHPDEITTLFDPAIVYAKGGRLLRMLQQYLGNTAFRDGLRDYFHTFAYGNTSSSDLWRSLSAHSEKDIEGLMDSWLQQSGVPLVDVTTNPHGYTLKQHRLVVGAHGDDQVWQIPLFSYQQDFPPTLDSHSLSFRANHSFPYLNRNSSVHFISRYDEAAFKLILDGLRDTQLTHVERLMLLFEAILLGKCDEQSMTRAVELATEYANDSTESVWTVIAHLVSELRRFVESSDDESYLNSLVIELTERQFRRLSAIEHTDDIDADKKLRALICQLRLAAGDSVLINDLLVMAEKSGLDKLHGELRVVVYRAVSQYGTSDQFTALIKLHNTTRDPLMKTDAIEGLTATTDSDHIALLLHQMTNTAIIKPQDLTRWFIGLMKNASARQQAWDWMVHNWSFISKTFQGDKLYESFARYSATTLNTEAEYRAYAAFFEPKRHDIAMQRTITIGLHELKHRTVTLQKQRTVVVDDIKRRALSQQEKLVP